MIKMVGTDIDAAQLARKGFHVFPVRPNSKLPAIKNFPEEAIADPYKVLNWFTPLMDHNIGISTTRFKDSEALVVIDVDNKGEKRGSEELLKLELQGYDFPKTFTQTTPTGGIHLVYRTSQPLKQGVNVLAPGLDIRSRGGFIVGAGSRIGAGTYTCNDLEPAEAPAWLVEKLGKAPEKAPDANKKIANLNEETAAKRAIHYLQNEAPPSIKGQGGDHTAYKVAARVKDFGVDRGTCLDIMLEFWNPRCSPPGWTAEKLQKKVDHAYTYGLKAIGEAAPEAVFKPIVVEESKEAMEGVTNLSYLDELNTEYALVYIEGGHFILHETIDERGRKKRSFLTETTFKRKLSPYTIQSGKGRPQTYADVWLDWSGRREYKGICFAPEREARHGYYNLWRGFTVDPVSYSNATPEARRGFDMFLQHALENVCGGDKSLFAWLMGYFAHMIQTPFERPLTTLVFRGLKGVGKNALVDRVGYLLGGSHYLVAHDGRYLTSNFNGHMDSCLCLVLDEAFWSGDKAAEGKLKGITTAPEIMIERKGKEPYMVDNLVRLVVIGNEDWLVPASYDERRYAVFDVGSGHKQNQKFFREMRELMDNDGGANVLLDYLQRFDLNTVNVNSAPSTVGLHDQKMASLDPFYQWWFECLMSGALVGGEFSSGHWETEVPKARLRNALKKYAQDRQIKSRIPHDSQVGVLLRRCMPSVVSNQKRREGSELINVYRFPELVAARKEWEDFMKHEVVWE